jgi:hypothetical protein
MSGNIVKLDPPKVKLFSKKSNRSKKLCSKTINVKRKKRYKSCRTIYLKFNSQVNTTKKRCSELFEDEFLNNTVMITEKIKLTDKI